MALPPPEPPTLCVTCGVFKEELKALVDRKHYPIEVLVIDSMDHMKPRKLGETISNILDSNSERNIILIYGDCYPYAKEAQFRKNVVKIEGVNCGEMILGKEQYRALQKDKAFIFFPELTIRWKEIFSLELGFKNQENARSFMKENRSRLVYIDTGVIPVPQDDLDELKDYFDMPLEVLSVSLDIFSQKVENALNQGRNRIDAIR